MTEAEYDDLLDELDREAGERGPALAHLFAQAARAIRELRAELDRMLAAAEDRAPAAAGPTSQASAEGDEDGDRRRT